MKVSMTIYIPVRSVTIVLTDGSDYVSINTELPSAMPGLSTECQCIAFNTARDQGIDYVVNVLNISHQIIKIIDDR